MATTKFNVGDKVRIKSTASLSYLAQQMFSIRPDKVYTIDIVHKTKQKNTFYYLAENGFNAFALTANDLILVEPAEK